MPKTSWIIVFLCLFVSFPAFAEELTLSYDDGTGENTVYNIPPGSTESTMFMMEHPATVKRFRMQFARTGMTEVHIWADGGGNDPDYNRDLMTPLEITVDQAHSWVEIGLEDNPIEAAPLRYIHIGHVRRGGGAALAPDSSSDGLGYSFIYLPDEPGVKYGVEGNFMVRVDVDYHDINTDLLFEDITAFVSGASRPAWGDYDNDGDDDLLVSAARLYRNNGDGSFTDVSEEAGIVGLSGSGVWADYDNDGHLDYYAFSRGTGSGDRDRLVHNNGDGTFSPVDDVYNVPWDYYPTEAAAWGDYDGDGWVDLYAANYELPGEDLGAGTPDKLWKNLGGGKFRDASVEAGVTFPILQCGRGVNWGDFDNDGDLDLYVSNYRLDRNFLWRNDGDGTFTSAGYELGVSGEQVQGAFGHSIGSVWGDFDNDGDLDLFVANLAHPRFIEFSDKSMFYLNNGPPDYIFTDIREEAGITYSETHSDPIFWDYDNDGYLDLFITCVYTEYLSYLYHNEGDLSFSEQSYATGLHLLNGWGAAAADYDRDGDLDLATRSFFRSRLNDVEAPKHWLQVRLHGNKTNSAGIGCRISVSTALEGDGVDGRSVDGDEDAEAEAESETDSESGGEADAEADGEGPGTMTQIREVEGGKGTGVQSSLVQHFGLGGAAEALEVRVRWVDGAETVLHDVAADQLIDIYEEAVTECLNNACIVDGTPQVCREWQWADGACPEGFLCEDGFCAPEIVIDGDEDEEEAEEEAGEEETEEEADFPETDEDAEPAIICVTYLDCPPCHECLSGLCEPIVSECVTDLDCEGDETCEVGECGGTCVPETPDVDGDATPGAGGGGGGGGGGCGSVPAGPFYWLFSVMLMGAGRRFGS